LLQVLPNLGHKLTAFKIANEEVGRGGDFIECLERIGFQALRVRVIQKYPPEIIGDILYEKSVDLMTAIIEFLSSSLLYLKHGFFCNSHEVLY